MAVLSRIADIIKESNVNWITMATTLGFNQSTIDQVKNNDNPRKEFVSLLTTRIWDDIFNHFDIRTTNISSVITGVKQLADILSRKKTKEHGEEKFTLNIDVIKEISERLADWERFGRLLDFDESYLDKLNKIVQGNSAQPLSPIEMSYERNRHLMNEFVNKLHQQNVECYSNSWKFWRYYLQQFSNGKEVVREMERFFPSLIWEIALDLVHNTASSKINFIGHPLQHESFQINKDNAEIQVNVGSSSFQMIDLQQHSDWLETQERYMDVFNLFKDKVVFNFHDLEEYCPILNTLEQFIIDRGGNGFATKGYHLVDHLRLFDQRVFLNDDNFENYFCFLGNENVVINFTKCDNKPGHGLHYSSQNIRITNVLHKDLQSKEIIQVNVLFHNELESVNFCKGCLENHLYIKEEVLTNIGKLKDWFTELEKWLHEFKLRTNISSTSFNDNMLKNIKKDMVTNEALQNTDAFPTFSNIPEDQMNEMKKIIFLTGIQFTVLHTNNKHIILRGPYGSGKSIVLRKKLENCIRLTDENDIIYYICHDQQSSFIHFISSIKLHYPKKLIIACSSKSLTVGDRKPLLSFILKHICDFWKGRKVHIFMDEYDGLCIDKKEISELKKILPMFLNSFIMLAMQSMEEVIHEDGITKQIDYGYQYDLLQKETSFTMYYLNYSLRCSVEINIFLKATSDFIEQDEVSLAKTEGFFDNKNFTIVDKEYGQENSYAKSENSVIKKRFSFSLTNEYGHSSYSDQVSVYFHDKRIIPQDQVHVAQLYIATIEFIISNVQYNEKFVVCTFDEHLYNSVYFYLQNHSSYSWTSEINEFTKTQSQFNILLTDYASVRGYEFPNFIFLLRMGSKYLKYRMIECLSRATTILHVIIDNLRISDNSTDNQLIEIWKKLYHVKWFDCQYTKSDDCLKIIQNGEVKFLKNHASDIGIGSLKRFPWSIPKEVKDRRESSNETKLDLYLTICYLCENDSVDIIRAFFKIHSINIFDYCGRYNHNLLHIASRMGAVNIIKYLISEYGFDVNCYSSRQQTPLHRAVWNGCIRVISFLIEKGADIFARDIDGQSPLHRAAWIGHAHAVELLIQKKADSYARDNNGRTPLDCAIQRNNDEVAKVIKKFMN